MKKTSLLSILLVNALVFPVVFADTISNENSQGSQATELIKQPHVGHSNNHHKIIHSEENEQEKSLFNGTPETDTAKKETKEDKSK